MSKDYHQTQERVRKKVLTHLQTTQRCAIRRNILIFLPLLLHRELHENQIAHIRPTARAVKRKTHHLLPDGIKPVTLHDTRFLGNRTGGDLAFRFVHTWDWSGGTFTGRIGGGYKRFPVGDVERHLDVRIHIRDVVLIVNLSARQLLGGDNLPRERRFLV
jgi:hypothetical protein